MDTLEVMLGGFDRRRDIDPRVNKVAKRIHGAMNRSTMIEGYRIEYDNHGRPQCPEVKLDGKNPDAWHYNFGGVDVWYYNYRGACLESRYLNKRILTIRSLKKILKEMGGDSEAQAQQFNFQLTGYYDNDIEQVIGYGYLTLVHCIDEEKPVDDENTEYIYLGKDIHTSFSEMPKESLGIQLRFYK